MIELKDFSREFANDALDIRGRGVVDCEGALIGRVNSVYVDAFQRKVRFIGVQGAEAHSALIPVDAITQLSEGRILIEQTRRHVLDSPAPDLEKAAPPEEYWVRLYEHYGYSPHWAEGNVFPRYPSV